MTEGQQKVPEKNHEEDSKERATKCFGSTPHPERAVPGQMQQVERRSYTNLCFFAESYVAH